MSPCDTSVAHDTLMSDRTVNKNKRSKSVVFINSLCRSLIHINGLIVTLNE